MAYRIPRFLKVEGYEILDCREFLKDGRIEVVLESQILTRSCHRCGFDLKGNHGKHRMRLRGLPILGFETFWLLWRTKGWCSNCKKIRSETVEFISPESPHLTRDYAYWLGRLMEISPVSRAAKLMGHSGMSLWRLDLARMQRMVQYYEIPAVKRICVDEVYARKHSRYPGESRSQKFFTIITDLNTRKVIWVSESRNQGALDEFFKLIGKKASDSIEVVAMDQHEDYVASVKENCKKATIVFDKFHLLKNFEEALNEQRKTLHSDASKGSEIKRLTRGQYRYLFLKRASKRTQIEKSHINDVLQENADFAKLEIIKERILSLFYEASAEDARSVFEEVGSWIWQAQFKSLMKWWNSFNQAWNTIKNYFKYRITNALAEGINHVIKTLKRKAYGYRNMTYFRLKIMQQCGYLNSNYVPVHF